MRQRHKLGWILGVLGLALLPAVVWAQAQKRTQTADITSETMTFNINTYDFEFTGNAKVVMAGPYQATVTAPKMTVSLTSSGPTRVKQLTASGPVHLDLISKPDNKGVRHRIVATAQDRAEYSEVTGKVVLRGNAQATIIELPETADSRRATLNGEVIEADLGTGMMSVTKAHMQITTPEPETPAVAPAPASN